MLMNEPISNNEENIDPLNKKYMHIFTHDQLRLRPFNFKKVSETNRAEIELSLEEISLQLLLLGMDEDRNTVHTLKNGNILY